MKRRRFAALTTVTAGLLLPPALCLAVLAGVYGPLLAAADRLPLEDAR